jgi:subfamily B ATP-binding cassette protein MsbA
MASPSLRREWETLRILLSLLRPYEWFSALVLFLGLLSSTLEGISLTLLIPLLHAFETAGNVSVGGGFFETGLTRIASVIPGRTRLAVVLGAIFTAIFLKSVVAYANVAAFSYLESRVSHRLRSRLVQKLLELPLAQTEADKAGKMYNVLTQETWRTGQALNVLFGATTSLCTALVFIPLLFALSWQLMLASLVFVAVVPLVAWATSHPVVGLGEKTVTANTDLAHRLWAILTGGRVIHSFGREDFEVRRFDQSSRSVRDLSLRLALSSATNGPVTEILITSLILSLALIARAYQMDFAKLAAFLVIMYRLQPRLRDVMSARISLLGLQGAVRAVAQLIELPVSTPSASLQRATFQNKILFENVTFSYPDQPRPALENISFEIKAGTKVAIVGPSGSGKSTLLDLLLGFRIPQQGRITIDSTPLFKLDSPSWRECVGIVSQDPYIFDETVRFNILYGKHSASEEDLQEVVQLVNATAFIDELPRGYDTIIGERGTRLSGGQRQRLVLARALIRKPALVVLDEATNSLDRITEESIQESLRALSARHTLLVVAHRIASIEWADHIVVLDRGQLIEQGTFGELIAREGLFAKLYALQSSSGDARQPGEAVSSN